MSVVNLHSSYTMRLFVILALTMIIGLTSSTPLSYEKRDMTDDHPKILLLVNQKMPEFEDEILASGNALDSVMTRTKRIGSLSIVNNLDVLRQRVLLELARRKALQDQRQVDENRRVLESIGKRSIPRYELNAGRIIKSGTKNGRVAASNRIEWMEEDDPLFRGLQDNRMARVQANELRLL